MQYGYNDQLTLTYTGNRLKKVTDAANELTYAGAMDFKDGSNALTEYTWDANGNMTKDLNRGISSVTYNVLNLPEKVVFNDGHVTNYTYDATGRKLRVEYLLNNYAINPVGPPVNNDSIGQAIGHIGFIGGEEAPGVVMPRYTTLLIRDYCDGHVYRNDTLERVLTPVGFIKDGVHHAFIKDYQGSVRVVVDETGAVVERDNYYPYGLSITGSAGVSSVQPYKYSAKELDRENGLDWYDFAARMYDPALGRFTTMDPLCEKTPWLSPYLYCAANPMRYTDPTGMFSLENFANNTNYSIIAVFQSNYANQGLDSKALIDAYNEASSNNIPIMLVDNIVDYANAMQEISNHGIKTDAYTITSHGRPGQFKIGSDLINTETNVSILKKGLSDKTLLLNSCDVAFFENGYSGAYFIEKFSEETESTVIGSVFELLSNNSYNNIPLKSTKDNNYYLMSKKGSPTIPITMVSMSQETGIIWVDVANYMSNQSFFFFDTK